MGPESRVEHGPGRVRGVFYGWWLVAISGFVTVLASVPMSQATTVWVLALDRQFHWNATQMGIAMTLARAEGGVMGPIEGYLSDRIGTRRMVLFGLSIGGVGFLLFSQVQNLWMFYVAYIVIALGQGFAGWIPLMTMLNHWFARRRAMAVGWSNAAGGLGALLLVPAIAWAIDPDHDRLGWRLTAVILGLFLLAVSFPLSRLIRNRPQDYGLRPDGAPAAPHLVASTLEGRPAAGRVETEEPDADLTAGQALRTPAFWLIAFGHGFTVIAFPAIHVHLGLLLKEAGFENYVMTTAWVVAVYTGARMVFQLVGGYVGGRIPTRVGLFISSTVQASSVFLLTVPNNIVLVFLFAVLLGAGWGARNPLTVAIRGEYFGRSSFGKILGFSTAPLNVMMLLSAPFAGYVFDRWGSYDIAFYVLGVIVFLGGVLFLLAKRPARRPASPRAEVARPRD